MKFTKLDTQVQSFIWWPSSSLASSSSCIILFVLICSSSAAFDADSIRTTSCNCSCSQHQQHPSSSSSALQSFVAANRSSPAGNMSTSVDQSLFADLMVGQPIEVFELVRSFNEDPFVDKVNLGVGGKYACVLTVLSVFVCFPPDKLVFSLLLTSNLKSVCHSRRKVTWTRSPTQCEKPSVHNTTHTLQSIHTRPRPYLICWRNIM